MVSLAITYSAWCKWAACRCWERSYPVYCISNSSGSLCLGTYQHLAVLADFDALSLHELHILQTAKNFMLNLEGDNHGEFGALLDLERVVLKSGLATRLRDIDGDRRAVRRLHGQRLNNADTLVIGIREILATTQAKGLLVSLKRLIVGVYVANQLELQFIQILKARLFLENKEVI